MHFREDKVEDIGALSPLPGAPEVRYIDSNLGCWSRLVHIMLAMICVHSTCEGW